MSVDGEPVTVPNQLGGPGRPSAPKVLLRQTQHLITSFLILGNMAGAAAGLVFWLLLARVAGLTPAQVGLGFVVVSLATAVAVVAKGGLDTALLRFIPRTGAKAGIRLLRFAILVGAGVALVGTLVLAALSAIHLGPAALGVRDWLFVAGLATLLVIGWLQDAYLLATADSRLVPVRNLVVAVVRVAIILPLTLILAADAIPLAWTLALAASLLVALRARPRAEDPNLQPVRRTPFLANAVRNIGGSASEFLPGLLLTPLVLVLNGPAAAAFFGIAWAVASTLFVASAAIGRSALREFGRDPDRSQTAAIRRAIAEHVWLLAPAAILVMVFAHPLLAAFGPAYATRGATTLVILAASILLVAPANVYLAVLRAEQYSTPLWVLPVLTLALLVVLAPLLDERLGMVGVAFAWLLANLPFGTWALWKLNQRQLQEVVHVRVPAALDRGHYVE